MARRFLKAALVAMVAASAAPAARAADNAPAREEAPAKPRRTVLQRAIVDHLQAGGHWYWRVGRFPV